MKKMMLFLCVFIALPGIVYASWSSLGYFPTGSGEGEVWWDRFEYCLDIIDLAYVDEVPIKLFDISETEWEFNSTVRSLKIAFPSFFAGKNAVLLYAVDDSENVAYLLGAGIKGETGSWNNPGLLLYGRYPSYNRDSYILYYEEPNDMEAWFLFNTVGSRATGIYFEKHRGTGVESDRYVLTGTRK